MDANEDIGAHHPGADEKPAGGSVVISSSAEIAKTEMEKTDMERNAVFTNLVKEDGDIVGLVAYSIYKQNKVDWLQAFEKMVGRAPSEIELTSYIIGESTPRRLATYRQLAGATLTGNSSEAIPDGAWLKAASIGSKNKPGMSWIASSIVSYAILAAAILIGVWLVARYGLPAAHS